VSVLSRPSAHTEALVLRAWPCGETSVIASLLSREQGYVKVLAKAARRPRSRLRALVEPGRLVDVEFSLDPRRELQYLRGGSVLLDPLQEQATLERSAFLQSALELVDRCRPLHGGDSDQGTVELFAVCEDFLRVLSSPSCSQPVILFFAFEWELLARHGMAPEVGHCTCCGLPAADLVEGARWFSASEGGLVCEPCNRGGVSGARPLSGEALAWLQGAAAGGLRVDTEVPYERPLRRELGALLHRFLGYHLPGYRLPAALDLLRTDDGSKERRR